MEGEGGGVQGSGDRKHACMHLGILAIRNFFLQLQLNYLFVCGQAHYVWHAVAGKACQPVICPPYLSDNFCPYGILKFCSSWLVVNFHCLPHKTYNQNLQGCIMLPVT